MHKTGRYGELLSLVDTPSRSELELAQIVTGAVFGFAKNYLGLMSCGRKNVLAALHYRRLIEQRTADLDNFRLLEFGPGSGYLGLVCDLWDRVASYAAVEITEGLYVYQKLLWEHAMGEVNAVIVGGKSKPRQQRPRHESMWKFADHRQTAPEADVIVSNHCLAEMSADALRCYANRVVGSWRSSRNPAGRWIAQSLGAQNMSWQKVLKIMDGAGLALVEHTKGSSKFSEVFVWRLKSAVPLPYESRLRRTPQRGIDLVRKLGWTTRARRHQIQDKYLPESSGRLVEVPAARLRPGGELHALFGAYCENDQNLDEDWDEVQRGLTKSTGE